MHKTAKRVLLAVVVVALIAVTVWLVTSGQLDRFSDWDAMDRLLSELGPWSAVFLVAAQIAQVLIPVIPSQLLGMASGALYGVFWGTALSLVGTVIGSWAAIRLARRYGRPFVERHTSPETIERIDLLAQRWGPWAFFLVAFFPFLPTDVGCFVAGLTTLRTRTVLLPIMLGRLPGVLILNILGATSTTISPETMVIVTAFTLVVAVLLFHFRERLERVVHRWLSRIGID